MNQFNKDNKKMVIGKNMTPMVIYGLKVIL